MISDCTDRGMTGAALLYPRGQGVLGRLHVGSTAMIYMGGQAPIIGPWRQLGNYRRGGNDVLPYFLNRKDNHHGGDTGLHRRAATGRSETAG